MAKPVVAIGLDSAEPQLIEKWIAAGKLPVMARLRERGHYRKLNNFEAYSAETPWTTFLTGVSPEKTGYWSPLGFVEGTYQCQTVAAYDYSEFPPFYALGDDYRVATFDVPQVRLTEGVNGPQVAAWGAHSPQVPSGSLPSSLFHELTERFGSHPGLHNDYAETLDLERTLAVRDRLNIGAQRRGEICAHLIAQEPWDLFVTVFGEAHGGGHNLWHLSQPDHPLYDLFQGQFSGDPLLELFQSMDSAIGQMLEAADPETNVILFSAHGMGPNTMDLPSASFLPELLFRHSFPGLQCLPGALSEQISQEELAPIITRCVKDSWVKHVWSETHDDRSLGSLRRWLKQNLPWRHYRRINALLESKDPLRVSNPYVLKDTGEGIVPWQPARWMQRIWPQMKAFALPSFAEGYVRVNLQGREPNGIVPQSEYNAFLDDLTKKIESLRDGRHGHPMAQQIIRTRRDGEDRNPSAPDADLVIVWQEEYATDVVESPDFGRIGPLPHYRSASHRSTGFMIGAGPDIPCINGEGQQGHALDLAPTILSLMNAPVKTHLEGRALL